MVQPMSESGTTFRDLFGDAASGYAEYRPRYPPELFAHLAARAPARRLAWDCATGSGQAAEGLVPHFERIVATDASARQLAAARPHERVRYAIARAEASPLRTACVDLITVAQALHWLDRPAFHAEAGRVLAPGGVLAVWCYTLLEIEPTIDARVRSFYADVVGPYWPPGRDLVAARYRTIEFPFDEFDVPPFSIQIELDLPALAGYLRTWSATLRYIADRGHDPVDPFMQALRPLWGDPAQTRHARFPLHVRAGVRPSGGLARPH
jgi:ubiquinone/menaquinone biosynthesis C-methylase UbiE